MRHASRTPVRSGRLLIAMDLSEAKSVLGFPPGTTPSRDQVNSAYKRLSLQHHPDRGGDPEAMVEINVAKDVLITGRPKRFVKREDPEQHKRSEHLSSLRQIRETAMVAANAAKVDVSLSSFAVKVNLRDYVTNEMADVLDAIEDAASDVSGDKEQSELTRSRAKSISAAAKVVLAASLKLATKYGTLFKSTPEASFAELDKAHKNLEKFVPALQSALQESRKLTSLLFQLVGSDSVEHAHPIPEVLADQYLDCQEMIRAFAMAYTAVPTRGLVTLQQTMQESVKRVQEILKEYDLGTGPSDWKQWRVPEDIDAAIDLLERKRRAASAVSRFRKAVAQ